MATEAPKAAASQKERLARWRSERDSPISSDLKLLKRARIEAMEAIAASLTSSGK